MKHTNKTYLIIIIGIILAFVIINQKQEKQEKIIISGIAQGTFYNITYYGDSVITKAKIDSIFACIDKSVSTYNSSSIISRINRNEANVIADTIFIEILSLAKRTYDNTSGYFDISIGAIVNSMGFGSKEAATNDRSFTSLQQNCIGIKKISIKDKIIYKESKCIQLDFKAIAQGYTVDLIASLFDNYSIENYLVEVGGEVFGKGTKPDNTPWKVGIEKPSINKTSAQELNLIVRLNNKALVTSGSYRKYREVNGKRYSHIINPKTGLAANNSLLSVSVLANNATDADAYATAFMAMGIEKAKKTIQEIKGIDAYFIMSEDNGGHSTFATEGIKAIIEN